MSRLQSYPGCFIICTIAVLSLIGCSQKQNANQFRSDWPEDIHRTWIGPQYWSNPLQDWELNEGRLTCLTSDLNRNVALLTYEITDRPGDLAVSVTLGLDNPRETEHKNGWGGFRIGARGRFHDYRDGALYGKGIDAGVTTKGSLFIGKPWEQDQTQNEQMRSALTAGSLRLTLTAAPFGSGYKIILSAASGGNMIDSVEKDGFSGDQLEGLLVLVANFGQHRLAEESADDPGTNIQKKDVPGFWFADWRAAGAKLSYHPERRFGPILFAQHTLSKGILKMTAQMPPISPAESQMVSLQIQNKGAWQTIATSQIQPLARTATFKVADWNDREDVPYRLIYAMSTGGGKTKTCYFEGTVRKDPVDKKEIVVAAFTGNNDLGFPNNEVVQHVLAQKPDLLFFSGDQIYEGVADYGVQRTPLDKSCLDYLRKWYIYGWEYSTMLKDIPAISIPDDHDVYQGNIWGEGGKKAATEGDLDERQDTGGYTQPPAWVNMVQTTQTSHLPDPYDPTPVKQGIGVYYTDLVYGGVSFAILEDRKFKSAPRRFLPRDAQVRDGWARNQAFNDPRRFDVKGAELLGDRQLEFLEHWANDWSQGVWMKVALSQTIFSNVATLPDSAKSDAVVDNLPILPKGGYPVSDKPTRDMDSGGWPKRGRDRALRALRKGFAIHIAGDQHLGSTVQYGVDDWGDAAFALCVPSVSNYFPRRWFPKDGPVGWKPGTPRNLGRFYDGFGNRVTVHAVANPHITGLKPASLYDLAPGYGIVKMDKETRRIEMANWPRQIDPGKPGAKPFDGWPVTFGQSDNYGKKPAAYLPTLEITGAKDPVVQVIDETSGEIIYTLRISGSSFRPKVFKKGRYTIRVGEGGAQKVLKGLESAGAGDNRTVKVVL